MEYVINELYHHGILGQRWGKKNGPPYPLKASAHSSSEKKAGWRRSLDKRSGVDTSKTNTYTAKEKKRLTPEQKKKLIKIGATAAVACLAVYGGYRLYKNGAFDGFQNSGRQVSDRIIEGFEESPKARIKAQCKEHGYSYREYYTENTTEALNATLRDNNPTKNKKNCVGTVGNWALRQMGINVHSKSSDSAISEETLKEIFKGFKLIPAGDNGIKEFRDVGSAVAYACEEILKKYPDGAFGELSANSRILNETGHAIGWKILNGEIHLCDTQKQWIYDGAKDFEFQLKPKKLDQNSFVFGCLSECEPDFTKIDRISDKA